MLANFSSDISIQNRLDKNSFTIFLIIDDIIKG